MTDAQVACSNASVTNVPFAASQAPPSAVRSKPPLCLPQNVPQASSRVQNCESVSGLHVVQTFDVQISGALHVPQFTVRAVPQLSFWVTAPQSFPSRLQNVLLLSGTHVGLAFWP